MLQLEWAFKGVLETARWVRVENQWESQKGKCLTHKRAGANKIKQCLAAHQGLLKISSQILYETYSSLHNLPSDQPSHIASNILKIKEKQRS